MTKKMFASMFSIGLIFASLGMSSPVYSKTVPDGAGDSQNGAIPTATNGNEIESTQPTVTPETNRPIPIPPGTTEEQPSIHPVEWYTTQVGLPKPSELGEERWFDACHIKVRQGWPAVNSGNTETCTYQHNLQGWQMLEYKLEIVENKNNRGSWSADLIAKDGQFNANEQVIGSKYKAAISLAVKFKDIEATRKLEIEYQRNLQLIRSYSSNKNTFFLKVNAKGGAFQQSIVEVKGRVRMIRIS